MGHTYELLGLLEDIKKAYIDTHVIDEVNDMPLWDYSTWTNVTVLWMPGWGTHVEIHAPDKDDPFIVKTDSAGLSPAMRALAEYLNTHTTTLSIELTSKDDITYKLSHTEKGLNITITRSEIPDIMRVSRKVASQEDTNIHTQLSHTYAPDTPDTTITSHVPVVHSTFPELKEIMEEIIETPTSPISRIQSGYCIASDEDTR